MREPGWLAFRRFLGFYIVTTCLHDHAKPFVSEWLWGFLAWLRYNYQKL